MMRGLRGLRGLFHHFAQEIKIKYGDFFYVRGKRCWERPRKPRKPRRVEDGPRQGNALRWTPPFPRSS